jgi:hypothetical protein
VEQGHGKGSLWQATLDGEIGVFANTDSDTTAEFALQIVGVSDTLSAGDFNL